MIPLSAHKKLEKLSNIYEHAQPREDDASKPDVDGHIRKHFHLLTLVPQQLCPHILNEGIAVTAVIKLFFINGTRVVF